MSDPPKHPNRFEHSESFQSFLGYFILYGVVGALLGRIVDKLSQNNKKDGKVRALLFLLVQLIINGIIFFIFFKFLIFKEGQSTMTFDDWSASTFQGLIFVTTFYSVQEELTKNAKQALF